MKKRRRTSSGTERMEARFDELSTNMDRRFERVEGHGSEIEGLITRFASAADFDVAGQRVSAGSGTQYEDGSAADLAVGVNVEVEGGFDAAQISLKLETKKNGVARDIVSESKNGYTLVVLGRRGFSGIREFILGSVSQKVLHLAKDLSVLMVN